MPRRKQTFPKESHTTRQQIPQKKIKMAQNPLILHLNDDCLWCIFSYLDLPELLNAGSVCQRFEGIAQMFYKNYPSVDFTKLPIKLFNKDIRLMEFSEAFRQLEPHMIAMKIKGRSFEAYFGRKIFSPSIFLNLQHIYVDTHFEINENYANIFPALNQIVLFYNDLSNESVANKWFKNSPQLKTLKIIESSDMTGSCLLGLKGIEEFKIYGCEKFQKKFFEHFCQMNPQLKKLSFDLDMIDPNPQSPFLLIITKYLKNLESLVIQSNVYLGDANYRLLCDLPKITKLRLDVSDDNHETNGFEQMLQHFATNNQIEYLYLGYVSKCALNKLQQFPYLKVLKLGHNDAHTNSLERLSNCSANLEELHILGRCYFKSFSGLKKLLQKFKSLKLLNICGSWHFEPEILMGVEDCLYNRSQMLEIAINGTPLAEELRKEPISDILKDFLDRTKGVLKLTQNAFANDGTPKKSFHEWEEWEAELDY